MNSTAQLSFLMRMTRQSIDELHYNSESLSISLHFLVGQIRNLINYKSRRRYNILTQVFSLKIHGISPACSRLIQSSNCLILPH